MSDLKILLEYYRDLGVKELYRSSPTSLPLPASVASWEIPDMPKVPTPTVLPGLAPDNDSFDLIRADIGDCRRCRLSEGRNKIVFGSGHPQAKLVFVGEAPGQEEDLQGLPFVGRAGQLLTQMINNTAEKEGIHITRDDVYIANVAKCRPPENRAPLPDEMEICGQFLARQLEVLQPRAICALGGMYER